MVGAELEALGVEELLVFLVKLDLEELAAASSAGLERLMPGMLD